LPIDEILLLAAAIGVVAFLYSSVGHAGASGYTAVLTLFGFLAPTIKPTALVLNIMVASIGTFQFWRAGHFSWKLFWPFAVLSIPASFLGGSWQLPAAIIHPLIGAVLLFSAVRLFLNPSDPDEVTPPGRPTAFGVGAGIGLLSGLTGTGGGVFLTPLLLLCRWAKARNAAAVSVVFILVNSIAGLAGHVSQGKPVPVFAWWLAVAAVVGGTLGSHLGSRQFPPRVIRMLLASTLVIAGIKLMMTR
jgi:uncharacterized protein